MKIFKNLSIESLPLIDELPDYPKCHSDCVYEDGLMLVCPMHAQEWSKNQVAVDSEAKSVTHDSNGNVLEDGDDVVIIKKCRYVVTRGTFSLTS